MPTTTSIAQQVDNSTRRLDGVLDAMAAREAERQRAEDAAREREAAAQAKADALERVEIASKYDGAFRAFGALVPPPVADEWPGAYRRRLFESLRRRLPSTNEWSSVRADEIPASARTQIEELMIQAAMAEAKRPSAENLPPNGELVRRDVVDEATGVKSIEWHGIKSFIKQMGRPAQRVVRICDPRRGIVLHGLPFDRVPQD